MTEQAGRYSRTCPAVGGRGAKEATGDSTGLTAFLVVFASQAARSTCGYARTGTSCTGCGRGTARRATTR